MDMNLSIIFDQQDIDRLTAYMDGLGRRASRAKMIPILREGLAPIVGAEKSTLAEHSKSGALAMSLSARAGGGDRPGTISVFASPNATVKKLVSHWGRGRNQQRKWAAKLVADGAKGRRAVFYGPFVHQGHFIITHGKPAAHGKTRTDPVPFARDAVASLGEAQAQAIADKVLAIIAEGD